MSHARCLTLLALVALVGAAASACGTATPGWTYTPAPPVTPAPSGAASGSAGPSAGASAGASAAASAGASAAASSGASAAASTGASAAASGGVVAISALNIAFEQPSVTAPAGQPFQITFDNKDAGVPHNVAIHKDNAGGAEVFKGDIVTGPAVKTYDVPALPAGTYAFACSVHPNMTGTLTAQ